MAEYSSPLSKEINKEFNRLQKISAVFLGTRRRKKMFDGTGGKVSVSDLIAYQIGWGISLIRWYEEGVNNKTVEMPGEGFSKWDYNGIARHFYSKYRFDSSQKQMEVFQDVVNQIIDIVEKEHRNGQLDKLGIWNWCTLSSGKKWPLSKWIRVNTISPYKRARIILSLDRQ